MKRLQTTIILFVVCISYAIGAKSNSSIKSFINEDKIWHWVKFDYRDETYNDEYFFFEGDTLINGIQAKILYKNRNIYHAALYEDGDKVYCCNKGYDNFRLLFDFGAKIGEIIPVDGLNYTVLDVEEIIVDNEPLRVLHLSIVKNKIRYIVTWVQGFGCISYPSYEYPYFVYIYNTDFIDCKINGKVVLEAKDIPNPNMQEPYAPNPKWVGATWSYYDYDNEDYSYFRYTVLDRPEVIDGLTYYPLVKYTTCEYEEGKEEAIYRIRQEGQRIYMRKEDFINSLYLLAPTFQEEGNDYIFYDFSLKKGDEYCKLFSNYSPPYSLKVDGVNEYQLTDDQHFKHLLFHSNVGYDSWIAGIGSMYDLIEPFTHAEVDCPCSRTLNYFCTADSSIVYRNPRTNIKTDLHDVMYDNYDHFKDDDCALNPSNIGEVADVSPFLIQANNGIISCSSSTATMFEVYTMDAVKVGETNFANGEAKVKVDKMPATYLYIVTYPNGSRESGKIAIY
ncbi:MAG: hypothetical protein IKY31_07690 [Bacteroidaceae bacterium]|nr:hypothetical protein [Bacteroidaceae bacterium]